LEGKLQIAQGGVFSYYEFTQRRDTRLTDEAWRERLENGQAKAPAWTASFLMPGGKPTDVLAFRVGDVYIITEAGGTPPLNMRAGPSLTEKVLGTLETGAYLTILEGPKKNVNGTWWKVGLNFGEVVGGWVLENPEWFERSHP
jgi:hypothetical protein